MLTVEKADRFVDPEGRMFHSWFLRGRPSAIELWISANHLLYRFWRSIRQARAKNFAEARPSIESFQAGISLARALFRGPSISQIECVSFDAARAPHELELGMFRN